MKNLEYVVLPPTTIAYAVYILKQVEAAGAINIPCVGQFLRVMLALVSLSEKRARTYLSE